MITGPRATVKRARKLRSEMSLPETMLWRELRRRPGRFKFRRQHPAGDYVLDFYCAKARLAVEVDGRVHEAQGRVVRVANRGAFMRARGIGTLRVPAAVILKEMDVAVVRIVEVCAERVGMPLHRPAAKALDGPPPRAGEDLR